MTDPNAMPRLGPLEACDRLQYSQGVLDRLRAGCARIFIPVPMSEPRSKGLCSQPVVLVVPCGLDRRIGFAVGVMPQVRRPTKLNKEVSLWR